MERKREDTRPHYDVEALKANLERCDNNIRLFQEAISKERDTKIKLRRLIEELGK